MSGATIRIADASKAATARSPSLRRAEPGIRMGRGRVAAARPLPNSNSQNMIGSTTSDGRCPAMATSTHFPVVGATRQGHAVLPVGRARVK